MNKQNKKRLMDTENEGMLARGEGGGEMGRKKKKKKGTERYKLPVIK